jgi:hypothetical protein
MSKKENLNNSSFIRLDLSLNGSQINPVNNFFGSTSTPKKIAPNRIDSPSSSSYLAHRAVWLSSPIFVSNDQNLNCCLLRRVQPKLNVRIRVEVSGQTRRKPIDPVITIAIPQHPGKLISALMELVKVNSCVCV